VYAWVLAHLQRSRYVSVTLTDGSGIAGCYQRSGFRVCKEEESHGGPTSDDAHWPGDHAPAAAVEAFKKSLRGQLIAPDDERYAEARQVWNANIDRRPGLICRPVGVADVRSAVNFAVTTTCWCPCAAAPTASLAPASATVGW